MSITNHKLFFVFSLIVFRAILDFSYINSVSTIFEYEGFVLNFNIYNYLFSWIVYIFCTILISDYLNKISDYFFITFVIFLVAPITSLSGLDSERTIDVLMLTIFSLLIIYFIINTKTVNLVQMPYVKHGPSLVFFISILASLILTLKILSSDITFNLDLERVYEFRDENNLVFEGTLYSYLASWTYQIFNMFLIAFFLMKRNFFLVSFFIVFQIFFFSALTQKEIIFFPAILLFSWYFFRRTKSLLIFPVACSFVLLLSMLIDQYYDINIFSGLFSRRLFFVPANLSYVYYEFFSFNNYAYWSNSFLKNIITNDYPDGIPRAIAEYMGSLGSMNNGYISSGYAQAGLLGIIIYSILIGFIFKAANYFSFKQIPIWLSISILFAPIRTLIISADLLTTLLTHGLILSLLVLFLARTNTGQKIE